jgi:hypothetical protein
MASNPVERPYTDEYLLKYSQEHLFYEFDMLLQTSILIWFTKREPGVVGNVLLESFTIHLRNVIAFLYDKKPRESDVAASDFCVDRWVPAASSGSEVVARKRADKEIVHLTSGRLWPDDPEKPWNTADALLSLGPGLEAFDRKAVDARLAGNARARLRDLLKTIGGLGQVRDRSAR